LGAGVACANPPANAFTPNTLSFLCNAGYSTPVVANACSACGTGKYKETSGNDVFDCLDCKQFSKSPSAAGCLCVQGYAAQGSALDTCVECAKGKYKAASANAACMDCPAGSKTLLARAFDIVYCVANVGFHKVSGAFQACPVGSFKPQEGDVACTTCPTYTTTLAAGSVASSLCVCVAPKCQAFGSACGCAPGFRYVGASQTCEPFPAGSFCLGTQAGGSLVTTTATPCPANSDSSVGAVSQAACACKPGYAGANTACALCIAGSFKTVTGPGPCSACASNSTSGAGSTASTACTCVPGYTGSPGGPCAQCAAGSYTTGGACVLCPTDSSSTAGSSEATSCICNKGYETVSGACAPCAAGTYGIESAWLNFLSRNRPFITSLASDRNTATQKFDSLCAGQTCVGNTGAKSAGTVTTGTVAGHGAGALYIYIYTL